MGIDTIFTFQHGQSTASVPASLEHFKKRHGYFGDLRRDCIDQQSKTQSCSNIFIPFRTKVGVISIQYRKSLFKTDSNIHIDDQNNNRNIKVL